jgi:hypothetical protein
VPFIASPDPEIVWTRMDTKLTNTDRMTVENLEFSTRLKYEKTELTDTGMYKIALSNQLGTDTASIKLSVVDRPSPPQGPMVVSDITPDSCVLTWASPKVGRVAPYKPLSLSVGRQLADHQLHPRKVQRNKW